MSEAAEIQRLLSAPFPPDALKAKPGAVSGGRALVLFYATARAVMDRLDDVVGPAGWQDTYEFLPDGSCLCKLSLRIGGEWLDKMDVGGESEQKDEGDRRKAAVSDALKRAAVKWGVGRYLYSIPAQWADYDPKKKQFVRDPQPPAEFLPKPQPREKAQQARQAVSKTAREDFERKFREAAKKGVSELEKAGKELTPAVKEHMSQADLEALKKAYREAMAEAEKAELAEEAEAILTEAEGAQKGKEFFPALGRSSLPH